MAPGSNEYIDCKELLEVIEKRYKGIKGMALIRTEHVFSALHQHYTGTGFPRFRCIDCKQPMPTDGTTHLDCNADQAEPLRKVPGCVSEVSRSDLLDLVPSQLAFDESNASLYAELLRDIQQLVLCAV